MRASSELSVEFRRRVRSLDFTRARVEALYASGAIQGPDLARVYEALFLNAVTFFEAFLEELFLGLLVDSKGVQSGRGSVRALSVVRSHQVARAMILSGRNYVDWLPYDLTKTRAQLFFSGGRPFTLLDPSMEQDLQRAIWIRNAIAHRSKHARKVFLSKVVGSLVLAPRERSPAGYLRSILAAPQTRYGYLTARLAITAQLLAK